MPRYRFVVELWIDAPDQEDAESTAGFVLGDSDIINASTECMGETDQRMHWEGED